MNKNCEIIQDLLPLYLDGVCSDSSQKLVASHLRKCDQCTNLLHQLQNKTMEESLQQETRQVFSRQYAHFRRKSAVIGCVIAGILMIPVIVCLIVNLAVGHGLDWFFIVLSALMLLASVTVLPLLLMENRFLSCFGAFTASLILLLAVCCRYTGGSWFWVAASSTLFGLAVCFLPVVVQCAPVKRMLKQQKALFVFALDTALLYLMLLCIGVSGNTEGYWTMSLGISLPLVCFAWILFALIRYLKLHGLAKAGICIAATGIFTFFADNIIGAFIGSHIPLPSWNENPIEWMILLCAVVIGVILLAIGLIFGRKEKKNR